MHVLTVKMVKRCELSKSLSLCHMHRISHSRHSNHLHKSTHIKIQKNRHQPHYAHPQVPAFLDGLEEFLVVRSRLGRINGWLVDIILVFSFKVSAKVSAKSLFSLVFSLATLLENDPGYFFF